MFANILDFSSSHFWKYCSICPISISLQEQPPPPPTYCSRNFGCFSFRPRRANIISQFSFSEFKNEWLLLEISRGCFRCWYLDKLSFTVLAISRKSPGRKARFVNWSYVRPLLLFYIYRIYFQLQT